VVNARIATPINTNQQPQTKQKQKIEQYLKKINNRLGFFIKYNVDVCTV